MKCAFVAALVGVAACTEPLDQRLAIVDEPRVLAIRAEPAEAKPGAQVAYRALVAGPAGPVAEVPAWSFCTAPKPPTEDNVVSAACIATDSLVDLGTSAEVSAVLPSDGCLRFGPDTPPGGYRPRDPDGTGGYYQPVRADVVDDIAFGLSRITCKLPSAPTEVARDYDVHYVANANPVLDPVVLASVPANADVTLTASWPAESAELYLHYDALSPKLVESREAMRVSWYATAGTLQVDASAVGEDETATSVSTTWHTPATGEAWLWLVLRDNRGGIAWQELHVTIE
jgi:hypothetical protein